MRDIILPQGNNALVIIMESIAVPPPGDANVIGWVYRIDWRGVQVGVGGAKVTLNGLTTETRLAMYGTGKFSFNDIAPGWYTIEVERAGYQPVSQDVQLFSGDNPVNIQLVKL